MLITMSSENKLFFMILSMLLITVNSEDLPCAPKSFPNRSVVCVCNSSYCDTITRVIPDLGHANTYTSSESGLRFQKTVLQLESCGTETTEPDTITLVLDPSKTYQTIIGFGGAVTDSAAINWKSLKDIQAQQNLIDSYFGCTGIQYNMIRLPMGGSDFSTHAYTYDDSQGNDTTLCNFTLQPEDIDYKIPMIKACMDASEASVKVIGSCWSAPRRMTTSHTLTGLTLLLPEYYQAFADYYLKFIQQYNDADISIWAVTTGNEPINGDTGFGGINNLGWTVTGMGKWVRDFLSPTLRKNTSVKIFGVDDQRFTITLWFNVVEEECPDYANALDGVALHYYMDRIVPVDIIKQSLKDYPNMLVLSTEACTGTQTTPTVDFGSWERADEYMVDIFEDLNNAFVSWIDWNMCLDMNGGPNWVQNFADSPIIVNANKTEFYKQPMFYALGHFSKFIPPNSVRISLTEPSKCPEAPASILNVAFKTPQDTVSTVLYNRDTTMKSVILKLGDNQVTLCLDPKTIMTIEMPLS